MLRCYVKGASFMRIDMNPILSGAKNEIDFSYPLKPDDAQAIPGVVFPEPFMVNGTCPLCRRQVRSGM